ncbi:cytochrome P450 [Tritonibacter scottomollicae]|uniref:Cytochrome P450 n=1 Tax=Tritonibacter scottomollicae TaxID=483013 RepID=A0ABZ0HIH8_TRISK|nr:cytochrome P450 [Tritonibacter scottomollicae]WOI33721.1 cytochrome P450 [Tritonibacter scottomollicae]
MKTLTQSPTEPDFVQNPYPFYDAARASGKIGYWQDYKMAAAFSHDAVHMLLRDRRFGREIPAEMASDGPVHLAPFLAVEAHSMLDAEPPRHTRLRKLVMRAFTSREIKALAPGLETLCHDLIDAFPQDAPFDLLTDYCTQVPVIAICRLLGVPEEMAQQLLDWSHKMVAMYQASKTPETEHAAARASQEFMDFLRVYVEQRRNTPGEDLITRLIQAEEDGESLTTDELIGTCILLLNAGHEATVHSLGNGVKTMLHQGWQAEWLAPEGISGLVEEILRYDPPLHMFTRYAYEEIEIFGHAFQRGDQVALMLAAANRDPEALERADQFDPTRPAKVNKSFGGGLHFCVGAPLARMEMEIALPILFARCPDLKLAAEPVFSNSYHFHGLTQLLVTRS